MVSCFFSYLLDMKRILSYILTLGLLMPSTARAQEFIDLSGDHSLQTIVQRGTETLYNGHPTTVTLGDGTILCAWSKGHGGPAGFLARTTDGGRTWKVEDAPKEWEGMVNCPSLYLMTDKKGKERLFCFTGRPDMGMSCSEDGGETWTRAKSLGMPCVMAFSSVVRLKNGNWLGLYHRGHEDKDESPLTVWQSISKDGGLTWRKPRRVAAVEGKSPCEPCLIPSPDGKEILCIMRENTHEGRSLMMTSRDGGKHWSKPVETSWSLTGDRHMARYLPDGRLVVCFRDTAPDSPTRNHFTAWVGSYDDAVNARPGDKRIKLMHSYGSWDCGYSGVEILPDGNVLAVTYIKIAPGKEKNSLVSIRFRP